MASSYNAFHNCNIAIHSLELEKNNFLKLANAFEEKYTQEKAWRKKAKGEVVQKDKKIVKLKGKFSELNKKNSNMKKATVAYNKESAKFEYEKAIAINEAINSMIQTLYKKSPDFNPFVLGPEVVPDFRAKELVRTLADEGT